MNMSEVNLYLGNCVDIMRGMDPDTIDLTVTSPPYDGLRMYRGYEFEFEDIARELYRLTKPGGVVVWVVGDETINGSESGTSFYQALYFKEIGFNLHDTMIYAKNGPAYPSKYKYYQVFEYMFVLSKGRPKTWNPIKDRENRWYGQKFSKMRSRRDKEGNLKVQTWYQDEGERFGVRFNIWTYTVGAGYSAEEPYAHQHPAIFPEALARDHILSWSNPGDNVLDPMCGSGTTGKMAVKLQRNFVGIEISEEYYFLAKRRIHEAKQQMHLPMKLG